MAKELVKYMEVERSLLTKYRKTIYSKVIKAIKKYDLISENDKIMVCISGGKDSFLLAKIIQELELHGKIPFKAYYVVMNPGYTDINKNKILDNAKLLNIPIEMFETDIFDVSTKLNGESPCYICARMRRGHLYNKAKDLGCNKIALGHHMNDFIETTLLSMLYAGEIKTMMPKLHSDNFKGIDLIRPLALVKENDIVSWRDYNELEFINCACKFTLDSSKYEDKSKRKEMKELIKQLKLKNNEVDNNIYKSMENVNFNCIIGGHKDKVEYSFLDEFNKYE